MFDPDAVRRYPDVAAPDLPVCHLGSPVDLVLNDGLDCIHTAAFAAHAVELGRHLDQSGNSISRHDGIPLQKRHMAFGPEQVGLAGVFRIVGRMAGQDE